ncbi:MAG TPA: hypothetical protein VIY28_15765 [Pseudonocardiaceae bacterium]
MNALDGIRPQLPQDSHSTIMTVPDDQKLATARHIAGVIATIKPQGPNLTSLVKGDPSWPPPTTWRRTAYR